MFSNYKEYTAPIIDEESKRRGIQIEYFMNNKHKQYLLLLNDNIPTNSYNMLLLKRLLKTFSLGTAGADILNMSMSYTLIYPMQSVIKLSLKELCTCIHRALVDIYSITYRNNMRSGDTSKLNNYKEFMSVLQKVEGFCS